MLLAVPSIGISVELIAIASTMSHGREFTQPHVSYIDIHSYISTDSYISIAGTNKHAVFFTHQ